MLREARLPLKAGRKVFMTEFRKPLNAELVATVSIPGAVGSL
jgi:hypothetical protein